MDLLWSVDRITYLNLFLLRLSYFSTTRNSFHALAILAELVLMATRYDLLPELHFFAPSAYELRH